MTEIKEMILTLEDQINSLSYACGEARVHINNLDALQELEDFLADLTVRHGFKQKPLALADYTCDDDGVPF